MRPLPKTRTAPTRRNDFPKTRGELHDYTEQSRRFARRCQRASDGVALAGTPTQAADDMEKCYGISKAGQNDCAAEGSNSCAGTSKVDFDSHGWKLVKKGSCTSTVVTLPDGKSRNGSLDRSKAEASDAKRHADR